MNIQTPRLSGRPVNRSDLDYVVEMDTDWNVQKNLFGKLSNRKESQARLERWVRNWETHGFGFWIFAHTEGQIIGHGGIFPSPREQDSTEVGYALKPAHWGNGYATEMAMASLDLAFQTLALPRVIGITAPDNTASRRVLEKCGMALEEEYLAVQGLATVRYAAAQRPWTLWRNEQLP